MLDGSGFAPAGGRPAYDRPVTSQVFQDRRDAGRRLAARLAPLAPERPVVVALPRGGVPVAAEIAAVLHAPLDVLVVRKVGAPGRPELGIGAVAEGGLRVLNEDVLRAMEVDDAELRAAVRQAEGELAERLTRYRAGRSGVVVTDRTVILVDDGLATGGTARVAARALRLQAPARLVLAVPVAAAEALAALAHEVDEIVCLEAPEPLWAIGAWYADFHQVPDDEVAALLAASA